MVRIITYNVHSCIGADGHASPARIAEVIAGCEPDIIALQEVDVGRARTGGIDQAHAIAAHLSMDAHFHPALHVEEEKYGDAILTALPTRLVNAGPLPSSHEQRGAIWVGVDIGGVELQVINTHLGLTRRERLSQLQALFGPTWLGHPDCNAPVVLIGDFNSRPQSPVYRSLARRLTDVQTALDSRRPQATFPSRFPFLRIDHIFIGERLTIRDFRVLRGRHARAASDHLPLVADVDVVDVGSAQDGFRSGDQLTREKIDAATSAAAPAVNRP